MGADVGTLVGSDDGRSVGAGVGAEVGTKVGAGVGILDGAAVGTEVGTEVGDGVTTISISFLVVFAPRANVPKRVHEHVTASEV